MQKVSVIIPTIKGRERLLERLLYSIPKGCEVIIVRDEGLSLAAKRNKGADQATGDYFLFIDDDNSIAAGSIYYAWKCLAENKDIGIVGFVARYDDRRELIADGGSKRHYLSGFTKGVNTNKIAYKLSHHPYEVDEVANVFMLKRSLFKEVGGFDAVNFPIDLDEADFCITVKRLGYKIVMYPIAFCFHKSITYSRIPDFRRPMNAYFMGRNRILFQRRCLKRKDYLETYLPGFFPIFIISYCLCLLYRRKPKMIYHFLKGVLHGLQGRTENPYFKREMQ